MKARTLVLMLCISLMCFTGFGNTTTDLTDNSTTELIDNVQDLDVLNSVEASVKVVSLEADKFKVKNLNKISASKLKVIQSFGQLDDVKQTIEFEKPNMHPKKSEGDVGWQFKSKDYNYNQSIKNIRNPRDGIRC